MQESLEQDRRRSKTSTQERNARPKPKDTKRAIAARTEAFRRWVDDESEDPVCRGFD